MVTPFEIWPLLVCRLKFWGNTNITYLHKNQVCNWHLPKLCSQGSVVFLEFKETRISWGGWLPPLKILKKKTRLSRWWDHFVYVVSPSFCTTCFNMFSICFLSTWWLLQLLPPHKTHSISPLISAAVLDIDDMMDFLPLRSNFCGPGPFFKLGWVKQETPDSDAGMHFFSFFFFGGGSLYNSYNHGSTALLSEKSKPRFLITPHLLSYCLYCWPHGQQRCISPWAASSAGCETGLAIMTNRSEDGIGDCKKGLYGGCWGKKH